MDNAVAVADAVAALRRYSLINPAGDGLNPHVSRAMRELVAARSWLRVCRPPLYASELNPVEPAWSNLKRSLANLAKQDIGQLTALVKTRLRRMQHRPGLLDGFLAKAQLDLGTFHN